MRWVRVKEGGTILDCECPTTTCGKCRLRFKCYTSSLLNWEGCLTLEDKKYLLYRPNGSLRHVKVVEEE